MNTHNSNYRNLTKTGKKTTMRASQAMDLAIISLEAQTGRYYRNDRSCKLFRDVIKLNIQAIRSLKLIKTGGAL